MKNPSKSIFTFCKSIFLILGLIFLVIIGLVLAIFIFKGKIYVEVIIVLILVYMFLFFKIWFHYSKKKLIKDYNPEDDKTRKCKEEIDDGKNKPRNGGTEEQEPAVGISDASVVGLDQPQRRELLQKTNAVDARKNRSGIRKILGRGRRSRRSS